MQVGGSKKRERGKGMYKSGGEKEEVGEKRGGGGKRAGRDGSNQYVTFLFQTNTNTLLFHLKQIPKMSY